MGATSANAFEAAGQCCVDVVSRTGTPSSTQGRTEMPASVKRDMIAPAH